MKRMEADRFDRLWAKAEPAVWRIVRRRLGRATREDREDVLQRIRIRAWSAYDPRRSEGGFTVWARLMADRVCIDWVRENEAVKRSFRLAAWPLGVFTDPEPTPYEIVVANELSPRLTRALDALEARHRKALRLVARGAAPTEIAAALRCTVPRAHRIVVAARIKAAELLTDLR